MSLNSSPLFVYTCTSFQGHYPVGVSAVIVAKDREQAASLLEAALEKQGLSQKVRFDTMIPISTDYPNCEILCNGDY